MEETLYIAEHLNKITQLDRETANGHKAICIWFTGLSGSGKSTLANLLEQKLSNQGIKTFVLDADDIRKGLNKELTFTEQDRAKNLKIAGEVAKLMREAGLVVIAAFISPFERGRQDLRLLLGNTFYEIFVDTPLEVCEQRDVKGLYKKARKGEINHFTGISSPYERPLSPDIHIKTNNQTLEQSVNLILENILPKIRLDN